MMTAMCMYICTALCNSSSSSNSNVPAGCGCSIRHTGKIRSVAGLKPQCSLCSSEPNCFLSCAVQNTNPDISNPDRPAICAVQSTNSDISNPDRPAICAVQNTNPEISNPDRLAICAVQNKSRNLQSRPPCNLCSTKQFQKSPIQTALKFVHYKTNPEISNPYRPAISAVQNKSRNLQSRLPCNLCSSINFL